MSDCPQVADPSMPQRPVPPVRHGGPAQPEMSWLPLIVDSDGTTFGPGEFVSYDAGTHHSSWTERGCLIAVSSGESPTLPHVVSSGNDTANRR